MHDPKRQGLLRDRQVNTDFGVRGFFNDFWKLLFCLFDFWTFEIVLKYWPHFRYWFSILNFMGIMKLNNSWSPIFCFTDGRYLQQKYVFAIKWAGFGGGYSTAREQKKRIQHRNYVYFTWCVGSKRTAGDSFLNRPSVKRQNVGDQDLFNFIIPMKFKMKNQYLKWG